MTANSDMETRLAAACEVQVSSMRAAKRLAGAESYELRILDQLMG